MKNLLNAYINFFIKEKKQRRRVLTVLAMMAVFAGLTALWQLRVTGLAQTNDALCGVKEHVHTEDCITRELVCGQEETDGHIHTDDCYAVETVLACEEQHEHTENCYMHVRSLTCGQEECEAHHHTDDCYLAYYHCGYEAEHTHTEACYVDAGAQDDWEAELPEQTGIWAQDLLAVAQSQLGTEESQINYIKLEDGTRMGYTRYGAKFGAPYMQWDAAFVSFCLHYAGISEEIVPYGTEDMQSWADALNEQGMLFNTSEHSVQPGDAVLLRTNDETQTAQTAGIVETNDNDTLTVIGRSANNMVEEIAYTADSVVGVVPIGELQAEQELLAQAGQPQVEQELTPEQPVETAPEQSTTAEQPAGAAQPTAEQPTEETTEQPTEATAQTAQPTEETEETAEQPTETKKPTSTLRQKTRTLTASGDHYLVIATFTAAAEIPEDAELRAEEYDKDSEAYQTRYAEMTERLGETDNAQTRIFNVGFYVDGKEIEPKAAVNVKIVMTDERGSKSYSVMHFGADGTEVVDSADAADTTSAVSFAVDSFSDILVRAADPPIYGVTWDKVSDEMQVNTTTPVADTWGDTYAYTLENLLNGYTVVTFGNATLTNHCMGAVLVGGHFNSTGSGFSDGNNLPPSYIKGWWYGTSTFNQRNDDTNGPLYLGSNNTIIGSTSNVLGNDGSWQHQVQNTLTDASGTLQTYTLGFGKHASGVYISDSYFDFARAERAVRAASAEFMAKQTEVIDCSVGGVIDIPAGSNVALKNVRSASEINIIGAEDSKSNTIINVLDGGEYDMPRVLFNGQQQSVVEVNPNGTSLVWNYPNAEKVKLPDQSWIGHVIAPDAMVTQMTGNYNGTMVCKEFVTGAEGHVYPYRGEGLVDYEFDAKKSVDGKMPTADETFKFELYKAKETANINFADELPGVPKNQWDKIDETTNNGSKIKFETLHFGKPDAGKTYWFKMVELDKDMPAGYVSDTTVYYFSVKIANEPDASGSYTATRTYYGTFTNEGPSVEEISQTDAVFYNKGPIETTAKLEAHKAVNGNTPTDDQKFKFDLTLVSKDGKIANTVIESVQNDGETVSFSPLSFKVGGDNKAMAGCNGVGTYIYKITESKQQDDKYLTPEWTLDTETAYYAKVVVKQVKDNNGKRQLVADVTYYSDEKCTQEIQPNAVRFDNKQKELKDAVQVQKVWKDASDNTITDENKLKDLSITARLYKQKVQSKEATVKINASSRDGDPSSREFSVQQGTNFTVTSETDVSWSLSNGDSASGKTYSFTVTGDMELTIRKDGGYLQPLGAGNVDWKPWSFNYTPPSTDQPQTGVGEKELVKEFTLDSSNWTEQFNNLEEGYLYTVEELTVNGESVDDSTVTYLNNKGITNGYITITNTLPKSGDYDLPATGGIGTLPLRLLGGGLLSAAFALALLLRRKHR